mgnify:FL=1
MFKPQDLLTLDLTTLASMPHWVWWCLGITFIWLCLKASVHSTGHLFIITVDYLLSVVLFRRAGVTISSMSALARNKGKQWGCVLCRVLDWIDTDHCTNAIQADIERANRALDTLKG